MEENLDEYMEDIELLTKDIDEPTFNVVDQMDLLEKEE